MTIYRTESILTSNMKKTLFLTILFLIPEVVFGATDAEIKSSVLQKLLAQFVAQVNTIDSIQKDVAGSANPAQFSTFNAIIVKQLSFTTESIAALLAPAQTTGTGNVGAPVESTPVATIPVLQLSYGKQTKPELAHYVVFTTSDPAVSKVNLARKNGDILFSVQPKITSVYSDGNYQYQANFPQALTSYATGNEDLIFTTTLENKNGAIYVSPQAHTKTLSGNPEVCVADYCK